MSNFDPKLALFLTVISGLFITGGTVLIVTGHDITAFAGLIPVLVTNLMLFTRVHKVEKNTNGNMSKLIDAALQTKKDGTDNGGN